MSRSRRALARHRPRSTDVFSPRVVDERPDTTRMSTLTNAPDRTDSTDTLSSQLPASNLDLRPYLHIHDLDFRLIVNGNKPPNGVVVGVTVRQALVPHFEEKLTIACV